MTTTTLFSLTARLTAEQEIALGLAIRTAEAEALQAVRGVPEADAILNRRSARPEQTRAGAVWRLRDAVDAVVRLARTDPSLADRARRGRTAWGRSHDLSWQLALSARRVVPGLARSIAGPTLDPEDLVHEGYIGLYRAARRFDPGRGIRFCTYARWWARAQMTRAIDAGGRSIRLPGGAVHARRQLRRFHDARLAQGEDVMTSQLAADTGLTDDRVDDLLASRTVVSLDLPAGDELGTRTLGEVLADETAVEPDESAILGDLTRRVLDAVDALDDERLRDIVQRRFGLVDGEARTLRQVGAELGVSRERVRQLEKRALAWLKAYAFDTEAA